MVCGLRGQEGDPVVVEGLSKSENIFCRTTAAMQKNHRATRAFQIVAGVKNRACMKLFDNPLDACRGADLVTTDVWTSMGYEAENERRLVDFEKWCVDAEMMAVARPDALFMHCLPAHRGEEVTADVIDGPQSVVWDEAENRMHVQKALMEYLLLGRIG